MTAWDRPCKHGYYFLLGGRTATACRGSDKLHGGTYSSRKALGPQCCRHRHSVTVLLPACSQHRSLAAIVYVRRQTIWHLFRELDSQQLSVGESRCDTLNPRRGFQSWIGACTIPSYLSGSIIESSMPIY
jgi:hypothetical protein